MVTNYMKMIFVVQGPALYAHYGQESEFRLLRDKNINMTGRVMLIRTGKISFAEKVRGKCQKYKLLKNIYFLLNQLHDYFLCLQVANAAKMGASAVLIYPDPTDNTIDENTELYGHVSRRIFKNVKITD